MNAENLEKKHLVGIRREDKSYWERRVTCIPEHCQQIMKQNPDIQFIVQPSDRRIFSDSEYQDAGCLLSEDLSKCSLILGVKEIPISKLMPHKTYMFFSHTIKAQKDNMPTLDHMLKSKIRMLDYEKITDENGARLVAFGRFAGIAGAIDYLAGMGQYLLQMGYNTPFLGVSPSYKYFNLQQAYEHIRLVGKNIQKQEIPDELSPMVFAITGKGRCSLGAMEVLQNLPIIEVKPEELKQLCENKNDPRHKKNIYVCYIESQHMVARKSDGKFDKKEYYKKPENYKPIFADKFLPYISSIFHNMYWDQRFPRLISCEEIRQLWKTGNRKLIGIGDVTCDFEGSIEFLRKFTTPDNPFWCYNPIDEDVIDGVNYKKDYILYQSLDFLPCELANDASTHFSKILKEWIPNVARSNIDDPYDKQTLLPHIKRANITLDGKLTPPFKYITAMRKANEAEDQLNSQQEDNKGLKITQYMKLFLRGHLFKKQVANLILDICEENKVQFNVNHMIPGMNEDYSEMTLLLHSKDGQVLQSTLEKISKICDQHDIQLYDAPMFNDKNQEHSVPRL